MSNQVTDIRMIKMQFSEWESTLNGDATNLNIDARKQALIKFAARGFPHRKEESWKYTNLEKLLKMGFSPTLHFEPGDISADAFNSMLITPISDQADNNVRLVFIDGHYSSELSHIPEIDGFSFTNLRDHQSGALQTLDVEEGLIHLNTAFAIDGAIIEISEKAIIERPIELYNITTCPGLKMIQPRHSIVIGEAAQATIIESYHNLCVGQSFTNCVTTVDIAASAVLNYIKIEHPKKPNTFIIDHTLVNQAANSNFKLHTLTLSGTLVRNNLYIKLGGEYAETHMMGLYLLDNEDHTDNRTIVDHVVPNCYSNELYKGILDGASTGVFNGKIIVRQDAQKTNAYQNNRNILVSDEATINTKPQLEIYADDVKCSHGATSAQIEDNELFYLRSRGIGKDKARALLMYAFAGEIWADIKVDAVKAYIEKEVCHSLEIEMDQ